MNNIQPKISVIVPVHNAGDYFCECLNSLTEQTLNELEIILILDSPTDNSATIAKAYAQKDDRIFIFENKTNQHIGKSRNIGLSHAHGEYITFSDHDDSISLDMYEIMYETAIRNNSDVVLSYQYDSDYEAKRYYKMPAEKEPIFKNLIRFGTIEGALYNNVTSNIYRRKFLEIHNIKFKDTHYITPEDVLFQIESIHFAKNISFVSKAFYFHRKHNNNEGRNKTYTGYRKRSAGLYTLYLFLCEQHLYQKYKTEFLSSVSTQFINALIATLYPKPNPIIFFKALNLLRSYPYCKEAFKDKHLLKKKDRILNRILLSTITTMIKI